MKNNKNSIEIQNLITKLITKSKKNNKTTIEKFEKIIIEGDFDKIIKFMLDNNINLTNLTGVSYSFMKILYSETEIKISELEEYKLLKKMFSKSENIDMYIKYLKMEYKSPNRKKGDLFKKIILHYNKHFNDFKIITAISDVNNNIKNYIYLPEVDNNIFKVLSSEGFELKDINIIKGRDILIKKEDNFYIGEAKEIHEKGGSQNNQLKDLESALKIKGNIDNKIRLQGFGILYGASIFYNNKYSDAMNKKSLIFSLDEFIFNFDNVLNIFKDNV